MHLPAETTMKQRQGWQDKAAGATAQRLNAFVAHLLWRRLAGRPAGTGVVEGSWCRGVQSCAYLSSSIQGWQSSHRAGTPLCEGACLLWRRVRRPAGGAAGVKERGGRRGVRVRLLGQRALLRLHAALDLHTADYCPQNCCDDEKRGPWSLRCACSVCGCVNCKLGWVHGGRL